MNVPLTPPLRCRACWTRWAERGRIRRREGWLQEFGMANTPYYEVHLRDGERVVAWVFVGPQDTPGVCISMGRIEHPEGGATLYGDLLCGNAKQGGYLIDVEVTVGQGPDGPLLLGGGDRYDL